VASVPEASIGARCPSLADYVRGAAGPREAPQRANAYALMEVSGFNSLLKLYDTEATAVAAFA